MRNKNTYESLYQRRLASVERQRATAPPAPRKVRDPAPVDPEPKNEAPICIKIEIFNEDLGDTEMVVKVDGQLGQTVGAFKLRHFENELSSNKSVQLVFKGQTLNEDAKTLKDCGFFDNCVVRCLMYENHQRVHESMTAISPNVEPPKEEKKKSEQPEGWYVKLKRVTRFALPRFILISFAMWFSWYLGWQDFNLLTSFEDDVFQMVQQHFMIAGYVLFAEFFLFVGGRVLY